VRESERVVTLQDYGFETNGSFSLRVGGGNISGVCVLLPRMVRSLRHMLDGVNCTNITVDILKSPIGSGRSLVWDGLIEMTGTYVPIILNSECHSFTVELDLYNPDSHLDHRDSFLPDMYFVLSVVSIVIAGSLLLNRISHWRFRIDVHSWLIASLCLRSVSLYVNSSYWSCIRFNGHVPLTFTLSVKALHIASLSGRFTIHALLLSGWGTYRETVTDVDYLVPLNLSWIFFLAKSFASCECLEIGCSCAFTAMIMGWHYHMYICRWLAIPSRLIVELKNQDEVAHSKLEVVQHFGNIFRSLIYIGLLLIISGELGHVRHSTLEVVEESLYLSLSLSELYFFWICDVAKPYDIYQHRSPFTSVRMLEEPGQGPVVVFLL
jgi:hypothetical protein